MGRTSWRAAGLGQRVATLALVALALIALVAVLAGCGSSDGSGSSASSSTHHGSRASATRQASSSSDAGGGGGGSTGSVALSSLPEQARRTVELIDAGGPFPYSRDGVVFGNYEHALPAKPKGWYHEYTVPTPGASNRGTRRIIEGKDGTLYYTGDHYRTFATVRR